MSSLDWRLPRPLFSRTRQHTQTASVANRTSGRRQAFGRGVDEIDVQRRMPAAVDDIKPGDRLQLDSRSSSSSMSACPVASSVASGALSAMK